jgi:CRP-like cAMP-binding protein
MVEATRTLGSQLESLGGYFQKQDQGYLLCRIPAEHFRECADSLPRLGVIVRESLQVIDVSEEHADLELRIKNARQTRDRLLALLATTEEVADLLLVEKELHRLTEEVERLEGALRVLSHRVAYSSLEIHLRSVAPPTRSRQPQSPSRFPWINQVGVERLLNAF